MVVNTGDSTLSNNGSFTPVLEKDEVPDYVGEKVSFFNKMAQ